MDEKQEERVRRNYAVLEEIETLTLQDALKALKGEDGNMPQLTDTARGQLLKFLEKNGFNADLSTLPTVAHMPTDLTAEDLVATEEPKW